MVNSKNAEAIGVVAGLALRTVAQLCQDVAQTAPIPGLGPAATIVLTILALSEGVALNKKEAWYLSNRCVGLLETLRDGTRGLPPSLVTQSINHTSNVLENIQRRYQTWTGYNKMDQVLYYKRTSDEILGSHAEISHCLEEFNVAAHLDLLQFENQAEEARQQDTQHMLSKMDVLLAGQFEQKSQLQNIGSMTVQNNQLLTGLMGMMQEALPNFDQGDHRHTGIANKIWNIKEASGILPPITNLRGREVRRIGQHPVGMGAQFDIWEGEFMGKEKVALKVLRGVNARPNQIKRFERESSIWREVWEKDRGQYVLSYYGTVYDDGPYPYMVSPWQSNGTLITWVTKYPDVDRIPLIRGIAKGLELLHTWQPQAIIHGDIKGENILIGNRGQPLITDFSLSKILEDVTGTPFTQSKGISDSYRWFAPEICSAPGVLSVQSDIFSFAMTILELITGTAPYAEVRRTTEVLFNMQKGLRPQRPVNPDIMARGLTDGLWNLMEKCWAHDPLRRIGIGQFIEEFDAVFSPSR